MKNSKLLIIAVICIVLFALLMFNLSLLSKIDEATNSFFQKIQINFFIQVAKVIGLFFDTISIIIISLIISVFLFKSSKKDAIIFSAAMLLSGLINYILKNIVGRARPENALIAESNFSFPSGHVLISVVFFGFLAYLLSKRIKRRKVIITFSIITVILISLSRLYLNVHWLSDILGGFLLGLFLLFSSLYIRKTMG